MTITKTISVIYTGYTAAKDAQVRRIMEASGVTFEAADIIGTDRLIVGIVPEDFAAADILAALEASGFSAKAVYAYDRH
jgi:hypothetical protein